MVSGGIIPEGNSQILAESHPPHFSILERIMEINLSIRKKIITLLLKLIDAPKTGSSNFDIIMSQWSQGAMKRIITTVCVEFDVHPKNILGQRRQKNFVIPRHVCWWLAREETMFSYPQIGRIMRRDHTSIIHGCKKIDAIMSKDSKDPKLKLRILELQKLINMEEKNVIRESRKNTKMDSQCYPEIRLGISDRTTKSSSDSETIRPRFNYSTRY
jgi:hypothetical protein